MAEHLRVNIGLNSAAFMSGIKGVTSAVSGMTSRITALAGKASMALAAIGAPLSAGAFAVGIKDALDYAGGISDVAARTGIAAGEIAVLQQAFKDAGLGAEQVGTSVAKMQKALVEAAQGGKEQSEALAQIGLSANELLRLSPSEQFEKMGKAIGSLANPAERSAASMKLFGKSGAELNSLFADPEAMAKARQRVGAGAQGILNRQAGNFDNISDSFAAIGTKIRGFFLGVADALEPALTKLAGILDSIDLAGWGQKVGNVLVSAINIFTNAIKQGKVWELIGLGLRIAFGEAVNYFAGILLGVVDGLGAALGSLLKSIFSGETLKPAFQVFLAIPEIIVGGILTAMGRVAAAIMGVFSYAMQELVNMMPPKLRKFLTGSTDKGTMTLTESIADQNKGLAGKVAGAGENLVGDAVNRFADAGGAWLTIGAKAGKAFLEEVRKINSIQIIDTAEWKTKIAELAKSLNIPLADAVKVAKTAIPEGQDALQSVKQAKPTDTDAWAKVGLFAGGASAAMDYARRTADATASLVELVRRGIRVNAMDVKINAGAVAQ
jgi:hypothetical protein